MMKKEGRGGRRDEEDGGEGRKEGLGGRRESLKDASLALLGLVETLQLEKKIMGL